MKRFFLAAFCLISFFFVFNTALFAQTPVVQTTPAAKIGGMLIPGVNCGNSTSPYADERTCCQSQKTDLSNLTTSGIAAIKSIPGIGPVLTLLIDPLTNLSNSVLQMQKDTAPIACPYGYPSTDSAGSCTCVEAVTPSPIDRLKELCNKYFANSTEMGSCISCANSAGVWTGLGCVYGDVGRFIRETVFGMAIGLAGTVALICIIYAAFSLQISQGNPEKVKKAQELLTSCIMGLMLIIFSVFILRLIGVSILKLPGFG